MFRINSGRGLAREQVALQNASTGELRFATTNTFGRFVFRDVAVGEFYIVSVLSKKYVYETPSYSFDLVDSVTDIEFVTKAPGRIGGDGPLGTGSKTVKTEIRTSTGPVSPKRTVKASKAPTRSVIVTHSKSKESKADDDSEDDEF